MSIKTQHLTPSSSPAQLEWMTSALHDLNQCPTIYSGDLSIASESLTQATGTLLQLEQFGLWLFQEQGTVLAEIKTYSLTKRVHYQGTRIQVADYPDHFETLASRHGFTIENVADSLRECPLNSPFITDWLNSRGVCAFLEVPVYQQGQVVGVLWGEQIQTPRPWQPEDYAFVNAISALCTLSLNYQTRRQREAVQQQQQQREAIQRAQLEQAWQEGQRFIQNILDSSTSILYVNDFASGQNIYINPWLKVVLGYQPQDLQKLGNSFINQLVHEDDRAAVKEQHNQLKLMGDGEVAEREYRLRHRSGDWRWLLCRETIFQRDAEGRPTQIFGTATDITALKEANHELQRLAGIDGLTQVANRRSFNFYLRQVWENAGLHYAPLTLILCDIDYFKAYNDTYGHQAGDVCLQQVAKTISTTVQRDSDLVARYGGEEFAILLPNTKISGAKKVASNILQAIQCLQISHQHSEISPYVTISLGIATMGSVHLSAPDILIAAADESLYQAKREGRNRFCIQVLD